MTRQKATHLYVLSCGNKTKIGVTSNINQRIKSLQTGNPETIVLDYIEESGKIFTSLFRQKTFSWRMV